MSLYTNIRDGVVPMQCALYVADTDGEPPRKVNVAIKPNCMKGGKYGWSAIGITTAGGANEAKVTIGGVRFRVALNIISESSDPQAEKDHEAKLARQAAGAAATVESAFEHADEATLARFAAALEAAKRSKRALAQKS